MEFESKEVFIVMGSKNGSKGSLKVFLDGKLIEQNQAGEDVINGIAEVKDNRLYKLIKLQTSGRHILKLEFQDSNLELYAFTFG